jgi:hypothetical protein
MLSGAVVMLCGIRCRRSQSRLLVIAASRRRNLIAAIAAKRRVMLLTWIIDRLAQLAAQPEGHTQARHHIYHLESKVYDFLQTSSGAFFLMIACNLLAHAQRRGSFSRAANAGLSTAVAQAYIIESLTKVINFVFALFPERSAFTKAAPK